VLLAERPPASRGPAIGIPRRQDRTRRGRARALKRELHEELGIELDAADPWLTQVYAYPEKTVRLHFLRVHRWHGEPHGREASAVVEIRRGRGCAAVPANDQIMRSLRLPALYAITQAGKLGVAAFLPRLAAALERGVRLVQVRERELPGESLESFAARW